MSSVIKSDEKKLWEEFSRSRSLNIRDELVKKYPGIQMIIPECGKWMEL